MKYDTPKSYEVGPGLRERIEGDFPQIQLVADSAISITEKTMNWVRMLEPERLKKQKYLTDYLKYGKDKIIFPSQRLIELESSEKFRNYGFIVPNIVIKRVGEILNLDAERSINFHAHDYARTVLGSMVYRHGSVSLDDWVTIYRNLIYKKELK